MPRDSGAFTALAYIEIMLFGFVYHGKVEGVVQRPLWVVAAHGCA